MLRRVVRVADGWMPLLIPGLDRRSLRQGVARPGRSHDEHLDEITAVKEELDAIVGVKGGSHD